MTTPHRLRLVPCLSYNRGAAAALATSLCLCEPTLAAQQRVPTGFVAGADLLLGASVPQRNPVGGDGAPSPAVQAQLRLGHELGSAGRAGRLEGVVAGFVTHPSGVASWGLDSTYALQGYGGVKYTSPLLRIINVNFGVGYGGGFAAGRPTAGQAATNILPATADGHGPVLSGGLDIGFRLVGLVLEVDHFFTVANGSAPGFGQMTYLLAGVRFGR